MANQAAPRKKYDRNWEKVARLYAAMAAEQIYDLSVN